MASSVMRPPTLSRLSRAAMAAVIVALGCPLTARAEFGGSASVVARAFDKLETLDGLQRVRSYRPVDTLARLTWDDLGQRKAWTLDASLRYRLDWGTGQTQDDHDLDVLVARATWRSPGRLVGLQLGRIRSLTGMGWKAFDGARIDFPKLQRLRVFAFAGLPVELAESGEPQTGSFTWGTGVTAMLPRHGSVGVDYELRRFDGMTTEEVAGLDFSFHAGSTTISGNADRDLIMDTFGEAALVLSHEFKGKHRLEERVVRVEPVTPIDSVLAVFDIAGYDEARLSYETTLRDRVELGGYVSLENYRDTGLDGEEDIARVSATARWSGRREARHRSEAGWLDGWSGSRLALRHDSDWGLTPRLRVGAGLSFQDHENFARLTDRDQLYALRARIAHDHDGKWTLSAEVEQYFGRDRDTLRGMVAFGTRFGSARGERPWWGGRLQSGWAPPLPQPPGAATQEAPR